MRKAICHLGALVDDHNCTLKVRQREDMTLEEELVVHGRSDCHQTL